MDTTRNYINEYSPNDRNPSFIIEESTPEPNTTLKMIETFLRLFTMGVFVQIILEILVK
jgi:hypothetical protein